MAKHLGLEIEEGVRSARERMTLGRIDGIELYETSSRLSALSRSLRNIGPNGDAELFRYFPVAAIAALEGNFKAVVATIVNAGPEYTERGVAFAKDKLKSASDIVPLIHRKAVTIGDVVAYVIAFSSVANIENTFTALLDVDFKGLVAEAVNPYDVRNEVEDQKLLVPSVKDLFAGLSRAFKDRHILAHETASGFQLSFEDAKGAIDSCALMVQALDAILWATIWKDEPLTQYERNCAAWKSCDGVRASLVSTLWRALTVAKETGDRASFCEMQVKWKKFDREWMGWESQFLWDGSIKGMLVASSMESRLQIRKNAIEGWLALISPKASSESK
jgi:hypothetical protein